MTKQALHPYEVDWDVALKRIESQPEVDRDEMNAIVKELRSLLGNGFLLRAFRNGFELAQSFKFIFVWDKDKVKEFHTLFKTCSDFENFQQVLAKFKQGKILSQMHEGLTQLRTAFLFRHDFQVTFEPSLKEINKKPDLLLTSSATNKPLYIEISELFDSDVTKKINRHLNYLFTDFFLGNGRGLRVSGQLESMITDDEAQVFHDVIAKNLFAVTDREGLYFYRVPGKISFIAFKESHEGDAKRLARENGFDISGFGGPPLPSDFQRLWGKIKIKAKQLAPTYDNVIVIWSDNLLVPAIVQGWPRIQEVNNILDVAPHVAGVCLMHAWPEKSIPKSSHPGILQCSHEGILYSMIPVFRKGKENLRVTLCATFMKNEKKEEVKPHA